MAAHIELDLATAAAEQSGFERRDERWRLSGITVAPQPDGSIRLSKALYDTRPLFYSILDGRLIASDHWPSQLRRLRGRGVRPNVDLDYVHDYLRFQCPFTSRTFCREIAALRNGETVRITADGRARSMLERIAPPRDGKAVAPPDLRSRLVEGLSATRDAVFHISSGLDSTALALLAARDGAGRRIPVVTCTTRGRGPAEELAVVRRLSADRALDLSVFDFTAIDIWDRGRELVRRVLGYPIAHPSHLVRFLIDAEVAKTCRAIVTGRGPDECLGGYAWHQPRFADPRLHLERIQPTPPDVLANVLRPGPEGPIAGIAGRDLEAYGGGRPLSLTARLQFDLWTIFEAWNVIDAALAEALGVRYTAPFLDPDLMASLMRLPDRYKIDGPTQKVLLRQALGDLYPDYLLEAPKIGLTIDLRPYLLDYSCERIMRAIVDDSSFGARYLDRGGVEDLVLRTLSGERNFGWQVWSLFLCAEAYELLLE